MKTALLVLKSTLESDGIALSQIAAQAGIPIENVRRHMASYAEQGLIPLD